MGISGAKIIINITHSHDMLMLIIDTLPFMEGGWTCDHDSITANMKYPQTDSQWKSFHNNMPHQFVFDLATHAFLWDENYNVEDAYTPTTTAELSLLLENINEWSKHFDGRNRKAFPTEKVKKPNALGDIYSDELEAEIAQKIQDYISNWPLVEIKHMDSIAGGVGIGECYTIISHKKDKDIPEDKFHLLVEKVYQAQAMQDLYPIYKELAGYHGPKRNYMNSLLVQKRDLILSTPPSAYDYTYGGKALQYPGVFTITMPKLPPLEYSKEPKAPSGDLYQTLADEYDAIMGKQHAEDIDDLKDAMHMTLGIPKEMIKDDFGKAYPHYKMQILKHKGMSPSPTKVNE
jgi:hypothetical protein